MTAQSPARDQPRTPAAGTGVIRGRVVRADTGEPLRRVQVRIDEWSAKDQRPTATMTDAEGRYELNQLPAGSYHLKATRGGDVEAAVRCSGAPSNEDAPWKSLTAQSSRTSTSRLHRGRGHRPRRRRNRRARRPGVCLAHSPRVRRWRAETGLCERQLDGRSWGVPDLRRAARRLRDDRKI